MIQNHITRQLYFFQAPSLFRAPVAMLCIDLECILKCILTVVIVIVVVLFAWGIGQNYLLFKTWLPLGSRAHVQTPEEIGWKVNYSRLTLYTGEVALDGFLFHHEEESSPKTRPTVFILHSESGNIGHQLPLASALYENCDCNVLLLDYPGFGFSEGAPSSRGMEETCHVGMKYLRDSPLVDGSKVILYAQSISSCVAADYAVWRSYRNVNPVGLILENPITNVVDFVHNYSPLLQFVPNFLIRNRISTLEHMSNVKIPLLVLAGGKDQLCPTHFANKVHAACGARSKTLKFYPKGGHENTWSSSGCIADIASFLSDARQVQAESVAM